MLKTHIFRASSAVALAASVAAVAAAPAAARPPAKIALHKSVGGIALGTKPAAVQRKLGKPSQVIRTGGKISEMQYNNYGLNIQFDTLHKGDPADFVGNNEGSRYHTSKGIHNGSTVKALKRAYGRSLTHHIGGYALNVDGKFGAPGSRRTDFEVFDGKVTQIAVQINFNDV